MKILKNFARTLEQAIKNLPSGTPIEIWFQDEMRIGQKNGATRLWARQGTRPRQPADQRYADAYVFGAICPERGVGAALVRPYCDTAAMQAHLDEISVNVAKQSHAVVLVDRAGWHTTGKRGKRHRYYVSHRLVKQAGEKDLSGWRLPALQLEQQITKTMREHLAIAATPAMVKDLTSTEIVRIRAEVELAGLTQKKLFVLIEQINIAAGSMQIQLDADALIALLQIEPDHLLPESLSITRPFRMRKRGVETKLIIGDKPAELDDALISNIAKANHCFSMIKSGKTFDESAAAESTSKRRIQQVIEWASLAPDIVRMIVEGHQPVGLTSNWLLRHTLPVDWNEQRKLVATL